MHDIMDTPTIMKDTLTLVQDNMLYMVTFFLNMNPLLCWARSSNELMQSTASVEARLEQLTADSMAATKGLNKAAHILNLQPHVECPVHATADQVWYIQDVTLYQIWYIQDVTLITDLVNGTTRNNISGCDAVSTTM